MAGALPHREENKQTKYKKKKRRGVQTYFEQEYQKNEKVDRKRRANREALPPICDQKKQHNYGLTAFTFILC